jgi:hypothetical protein
LRKTDQGLKEDGDVKCETKDGMWGLKVLVSRSSFVNLDYDKPSEEGGDPNEVDEEVCYGAGTFLGGCVGGLEDKGGLDYEEKASLETIRGLLEGVILVWTERAYRVK